MNIIAKNMQNEYALYFIIETPFQCSRNLGHTIFYIWISMFTILTKTRVLRFIKDIPLKSTVCVSDS